MWPSLSMTGWLSREWTSEDDDIATNIGSLVPKC